MSGRVEMCKETSNSATSSQVDTVCDDSIESNEKALNSIHRVEARGSWDPIIFASQVVFAIYFLLTTANDFQGIIIAAPPKSGKRLIAKCIKHWTRILMHVASLLSPTIHVYTSSFHRKDSAAQTDEFRRSGFVVKDSPQDLADHLRLLAREGHKVIVHFDELDFGAGVRQTFAPVFQVIAQSPCTLFIGYSATPEEALHSVMNFRLMQYTPSRNFRGARHFVENGLIHTSERFWDQGAFTEQGLEAIGKFDDMRNIGIVRLAEAGAYKTFKKWYSGYDASGGRNSDAVRRAHGIQKIVFVDAGNPYIWQSSPDNPSPNNPEADFPQGLGLKYLVVINQTLTRSADLSGHHHRFAFYHDFRVSESTTYGTFWQAYGRMNHFSTPGGHDGCIHMYGIPEVFYRANGQDSEGRPYNNKEWFTDHPKRRLGQRMTKSSTSYGTWENTDIVPAADDPESPQPLKDREQAALLLLLQTQVELLGSQRARGVIYYEEDDDKQSFYCLKVGTHIIIPEGLIHHRLIKNGESSEYVVFEDDFNNTFLKTHRNWSSSPPGVPSTRYRKVAIYKDCRDPTSFLAFRLIYTTDLCKVPSTATGSRSIYGTGSSLGAVLPTSNRGKKRSRLTGRRLADRL